MLEVAGRRQNERVIDCLRRLSSRRRDAVRRRRDRSTDVEAVIGAGLVAGIAAQGESSVEGAMAQRLR